MTLNQDKQLNIMLPDLAKALSLDATGPPATLRQRIKLWWTSVNHSSGGSETDLSATLSPSLLKVLYNIVGGGGEAGVDSKTRGGKKNRGKQKKKKKQTTSSLAATSSTTLDPQQTTTPQVQVEYVPDKIDFTLGGTIHAGHFASESILSRFGLLDATATSPSADAEQQEHRVAMDTSADDHAYVVDGDLYDDEEEDDGTRIKRLLREGESSDDDSEGGMVMSNKKARKLGRIPIAKLKQLVAPRSDLVDWYDNCSSDPVLLIRLKATKNTVPVPVHWSLKRKYLQNKKGIDKVPYVLPDYIRHTGIMELRSYVRDKEESSRLKSKTRERVQPKMGKLDIDYQKLYDAFFRFQTKPAFLTTHGDIYYEGREFQAKPVDAKPGEFSTELREALNIPELAPPPWLVAMQRYGPPPSYPNLKIPGLNAPIPPGAQWGYHPGGWGKPPVDEFNRPLYGDVFGVDGKSALSDAQLSAAQIDRTLWGIVEDYEEEMEEEHEEEEEEEVEEEQGKEEMTGQEAEVQAEDDSGPSDVDEYTPMDEVSISLAAGRPPSAASKRLDEEEGAPKQLYTIVPQKDTSIQGFMGSQHAYDISAATGKSSVSAAVKRKLGMAPDTGIQVSLNPEDLASADPDALRRKYEAEVQALKSTSAGHARDDFSDLVAEHAGKQAAKKSKKDDGKKKSQFKF